MKKLTFLLVFIFGQGAFSNVTICGVSIELESNFHRAAVSFQEVIGTYDTTCGKVELKFFQRCENSMFLSMEIDFLDEQFGRMRYLLYSEFQNRGTYEYTTRRNRLRLYSKVADNSLPRSFVDIANISKSRDGELLSVKTEEYVSSFFGQTSRRKRDCSIISEI